MYEKNYIFETSDKYWDNYMIYANGFALHANKLALSPNHSWGWHTGGEIKQSLKNYSLDFTSTT